jgi:hypothetical protein
MIEKRAPRFRAYLDRTRGALFMPKSDWAQLVLEENSPVEIAIESTPMHTLVNAADIVGSFAERLDNGEIIITIFREDPADAPDFINTDKYSVWENTLFRPEYPKVVAKSSTSDDSALRSFVSEYVVIFPLGKGDDHHLPEIPARYKAILQQGKNAG